MASAPTVYRLARDGTHSPHKGHWRRRGRVRFPRRHPIAPCLGTTFDWTDVTGSTSIEVVVAWARVGPQRPWFPPCRPRPCCLAHRLRLPPSAPSPPSWQFSSAQRGQCSRW